MTRQGHGNSGSGNASSFFCIVDYCFKKIVTLMFIMILVTIYTRERDLSWNSPLNRMQFSYSLIRFGAQGRMLRKQEGVNSRSSLSCALEKIQ